ncbi:bifunctional adenosylcobinamide kinase/adenosylcobinamide-phosphate guanylyltransferase [Piscinibacter sp. HJYY11]|uniref:bifunctional adenosylcobinamide kinase/adenosylcobinamide-phosphate guanylyltransferase n=1 Tax=Piscinibacter sp. HJYY11 TaxID=2801333 RepID=UPI00191F95F9|nr:bifunctional adenosylcobinamide kinase/adenosylcobinamide-phosphate guanylyltransferase [Piscinibacter sp. HJYY11]MBL0727012.1 bifunctional adenosylcobinamide kinase/adenosylcobinamide-phosphate guanylyltransferase [Piscinibacter sp. HJYY11]
MTVAHSVELILGGQRSGKSRCAEERARAWLQQPGHEAVLVATAQAHDAEMRERIARHRADRAARAPGLSTEEVPDELPASLRRLGAPHRLVVVDCLTLWLTNLLMPMHGSALDERAWDAQRQSLCEALDASQGPVVLVSNEIGLGLSPMSPEARRFVDALGHLHQAVARCASRVTLMVAGLEVNVKGPA